jgi:hypothetical protein
MAKLQEKINLLALSVNTKLLNPLFQHGFNIGER